jgi:hypothetical protein
VECKKADLIEVECWLPEDGREGMELVVKGYRVSDRKQE